MPHEAFPYMGNPPLPETGVYAAEHKRMNAIRRQIEVLERTRDIAIISIGQMFDAEITKLREEDDGVYASIAKREMK